MLSCKGAGCGVVWRGARLTLGCLTVDDLFPTALLEGAATLFAFLFADEGTFFVTQIGSRGLTGVSVLDCIGADTIGFSAFSSLTSGVLITGIFDATSCFIAEIFHGIAVGGGERISGSSRIIAPDSTSNRLVGTSSCFSCWSSSFSTIRGGVFVTELFFHVSTPKSEKRRALGL